jgi:hypothetical protein
MAWRSSRCEHFRDSASSGPASGMAGDRGDDLAGVQQTQRSEENGTPASSASGLVHVPVKETSPRPPGTGTGRCLIPAGTAGLSASREGWPLTGSRRGQWVDVPQPGRRDAGHTRITARRPSRASQRPISRSGRCTGMARGCPRSSGSLREGSACRLRRCTSSWKKGESRT